MMMKKILFALLVFITLNMFSAELNLASFQKVLINPWWTHSGAGKYSRTVSKDEDKLQCVKLTGGTINLTVDSYRYPPFLYSPSGRFCSFSLTAAGKGDLEISINSLVSDEAGKNSTRVLTTKTVELSENWQKIDIETQEKNPRTSKHILSIKLLSGDYALMRDADFHYFSKPGVELQVNPKTVLTKPGMPAEIKIILKKDGKPLPDVPLRITVFGRPGIHLPDSKNAFSGKIIEKELSTNSGGAVDYTFDTDASGYGARVNVFSPLYGASAEAFVIFSEKEMIEELNKTAEAINISKPVSVLIIADGLSDFSRGYNYADIISSMLNKKNPGLFQVKNIGIGGDFITRVWERISGVPDSVKPASGDYRKYMYEGLSEEKPDILLVFLGHNDTRAWPGTDLKAPEIAPEIQYDRYCRLLDYFKKNSPKTKVILLSNISSYLPIQEERAAEKKAKGVRYCIYGMPEFMEGFNNVLKKLASERNLDYIDLYSPTKDDTDRKSLFLPDGIHLSPKGNQLTALIIMKNFADKKILNNPRPENK